MRRYVATITGLAIICAASALSVASADQDVQIEGDRLTVNTNNLSITFRGGDLIRVFNRTTGEQYVHNATTHRPILDLVTIPLGGPMRFTGWRQGRAQGTNPNECGGLPPLRSQHSTALRAAIPFPLTL